MSDEKEYMTDKNMTHCSEGDFPCRVNTKGHGKCKGNELLLNATDHWPRKNIVCYGFCRRTGTLCFPDTPKVWIDVDEKCLLDGAPCLTEKSRLMCKHGGEISFGQGNPYGINDFWQDLLAGKYAQTVPIDDFGKMFKKFNDNKIVAEYLDLTGGATGLYTAIQGAGLLAVSEMDSTTGGFAKGVAGALVGITYGINSIATGMGKFLEGVGAGEHDWDGLKKLSIAISPKYGEQFYDYTNLAKSGREALISKKIKDIAGMGKDLNDAIDVTKKKIEEYEGNNTDRDFYDRRTANGGCDKNLGVFFEIYEH